MQYKKTALHYAASSGRSETAHILIKSGASLEPTDNVSILIN